MIILECLTSIIMITTKYICENNSFKLQRLHHKKEFVVFVCHSILGGSGPLLCMAGYSTLCWKYGKSLQLFTICITSY